MPDIVEVMEAFNAAGGDAEAREWLNDNDIGPLPIPAKLLHATCSNDFELPGFESANGTLVFSITPGEPNVLAFPIMKDGDAIDLMLIGLEEMDYYAVCQEADWLGYDNLDADTIRLHFSPLEWLEAGCTGVVQIHPYQRRHMTELKRAKRIECNSIELALEAWEWGFSAHDEDLERFDIDDHPDNIQAYFDRQAMWAAQSQLRTI